MDNNEIARRMKLIHQENRLATFKHWKFSSKDSCSALKMAEAGFYFIGDKNEPDAVECFLCGKTLDGWEATDEPWQEHSKHSSSCAFAELQTPEDALTYYQFLDIKGVLMKRIVKMCFDEVEKKLTRQYEEMKKYVLRCMK